MTGVETGEARTATPDPQDFLRSLEATGRFRRDGWVGRLLHPGTVSYRELVAEHSLHVVIDGRRVVAHVDRFSPLAITRREGYSLWRAAVHNLWGMARDVGRAVGGRRGDGRCEPCCEWMDIDEQLIERFIDATSSEDQDLDAFLDELSRRNGGGVRRVPFSATDEIIDLLDSDEEPWSVQVELRAAGRLDEDRLRAAVGEAFVRHPMARARKAPAGRAASRTYWEIRPQPDLDPVEVVACPDEAQLAVARAQFQSMRVPLSTSPPLRLWLCRTPGGDVVMLNLHHAAADGFGALRILQSVARAYTGTPDPMPDIDFLAERDLHPAAVPGGRAARTRRALALTERLRDLVTPAARIAPAGQRAARGYGFHHERLSAADTRRLVTSALPGSVNDLLVAGLHLAIARWNADHGQRGRRITVLVPSNLRPSSWAAEVAANFSLPARVTTTRAQRKRPLQALRAVVTQTSRKKRTGMGTALLELLNRSWFLPRWARERLVDLPGLGHRLTDTAILSNLGSVEEPPDFGGPGEPELWFSAPARMPAGLSIGAVTVGGRLHLAFRYRHSQFGSDAAARFAARYLAEVRRLLDAPAARP